MSLQDRIAGFVAHAVRGLDGIEPMVFSNAFGINVYLRLRCGNQTRYSQGTLSIAPALADDDQALRHFIEMKMAKKLASLYAIDPDGQVARAARPEMPWPSPPEDFPARLQALDRGSVEPEPASAEVPPWLRYRERYGG